MYTYIYIYVGAFIYIYIGSCHCDNGPDLARPKQRSDPKGFRVSD